MIENFIFTGRASTALFAILTSIKSSKVRRILLPVNICEIIFVIVEKSGFTPVFYDVNETSGNADLNSIKGYYTGQENVLLVVHNFGSPLIEIEKISNWSKENNLFLIEDNCNSFGANYNQKPVGSWGDASIFSFGYAKIIENGLGGALLVKDNLLKNKLEEMVESFSEYSEIHSSKNFFYQKKINEYRNKSITGIYYNNLYSEYFDFLIYKISNEEKQQIIGKIGLLDDVLKNRKKKADLYRKNINSKFVTHIDEITGQMYWRYNILVDVGKRDLLINLLRENGFLVSKWYPPINKLFVCEDSSKEFLGAEKFYKKVVNLFVDERVDETSIIHISFLINSL